MLSAHSTCWAWTPSMSSPVWSRGEGRRPAPRVPRSLIRASGMFVPSDSFGGRSPERKAADALRTLFTFCAVKIVLAQMEGSGRGALGAYNAQGYTDLSSFLTDRPMRNGDAWLEELLQRNEMLALRVMEVRKAYCAEDFEWDICRKVAAKDMHDANVRLLRNKAEEAFQRSSTASEGRTD